MYQKQSGTYILTSQKKKNKQTKKQANETARKRKSCSPDWVYPSTSSSKKKTQMTSRSITSHHITSYHTHTAQETSQRCDSADFNTPEKEKRV